MSGRRISSGGSVISRGSYGIRMSSGSSDNVVQQGTPGRLVQGQGTPGGNGTPGSGTPRSGYRHHQSSDSSDNVAGGGSNPGVGLRVSTTSSDNVMGSGGYQPGRRGGWHGESTDDVLGGGIRGGDSDGRTESGEWESGQSGCDGRATPGTDGFSDELGSSSPGGFNVSGSLTASPGAHGHGRRVLTIDRRPSVVVEESESVRSGASGTHSPVTQFTPPFGKDTSRQDRASGSQHSNSESMGRSMDLDGYEIHDDTGGHNGNGETKADISHITSTTVDSGGLGDGFQQGDGDSGGGSRHSGSRSRSRVDTTSGEHVGGGAGGRAVEDATGMGEDDDTVDLDDVSVKSPQGPPPTNQVSPALPRTPVAGGGGGGDDGSVRSGASRSSRRSNRSTKSVIVTEEDLMSPEIVHLMRALDEGSGSAGNDKEWAVPEDEAALLKQAAFLAEHEARTGATGEKKGEVATPPRSASYSDAMVEPSPHSAGARSASHTGLVSEAEAGAAGAVVAATPAQEREREHRRVQRELQQQTPHARVVSDQDFESPAQPSAHSAGAALASSPALGMVTAAATDHPSPPSPPPSSKPRPPVLVHSQASFSVVKTSVKSGTRIDQGPTPKGHSLDQNQGHSLDQLHASDGGDAAKSGTGMGPGWFAKGLGKAVKLTSSRSKDRKRKEAQVSRGGGLTNAAPVGMPVGTSTDAEPAGDEAHPHIAGTSIDAPSADAALAAMAQRSYSASSAASASTAASTTRSASTLASMPQVVTKKASRGFNPDTGRFYHSNATTVSGSSEVSDYSDSASEWTRSQPNSQASVVSEAVSDKSEEADAGAGGGVALAGKPRRRNSTGKKVKPSKMRKKSSSSRVSSSATEIENIDEEDTSMV